MNGILQEEKLLDSPVIFLPDDEIKEISRKRRFQNWVSIEANKIWTFLLFALFSVLFIVSIFYSTFEEMATRTVNGDGKGLVKSQEDVRIMLISLVVILLCALALGYLSNLAKIPALTGMLLAGLLIRNLSFLNPYFKVDPGINSFIRKFAFLIILLRAGLGLDSEALKKVKTTCACLSFIPSTFEALAIALVSYGLLDIDPIFGLLLGFVIAAVSPAVVVPEMIDVQAKSLGVDKGIPTLIMASCTINDVYAITLFTLLLTVAKTGGIEISDLTSIAIRAPIEILGGCILGVLLGLILWKVPNRKIENFHFYRIILIIMMSCTCLYGSAKIGLDTVGPISVLFLGFTAGLSWRKDDPDLKEAIALKIIWDYFAQPMLFALIGLQLPLNQLEFKFVLYGLIVLIVGLVVRVIFTYFSSIGANLEKVEKVFIGFAWMAKATVQAALAPVLFDLVNSDPEAYPFYYESTTILSIGVLSILITAPLGALLIRIMAPLLLKSPSIVD